ncbi:MAG: hypothetical protein NTZ86_01855, partial [Legionellales bacterium]|nr:hypothetical protein [Legionellales bacterium]
LLAELHDRQRIRIEHLNNGTENTPPPSQRPHRPSTISPNYKLSECKHKLFPEANPAQKNDFALLSGSKAQSDITS